VSKELEHGRRRGLRAVLGFALVVALSACGGGSDGGSNEPPPPPPPDMSSLDITYNYRGAEYASLQVFKEGLQDPPEVSGLEGHRPHFARAAGSLPDGLTLDADTGAILGRPTALGDTSAVIRLTVEGHTGYLDSELHFSVSPFWFMYPLGYVDAQRGLAISEVAPMVPDYDDAVTLSFETWPAGSELPPGVVLNSSTGAISGTPSAEGSYAITVVAKASYDGRQAEAEQRIDLFVSPITDVGFGYDTVQWEGGKWLSVAPYITLQPGDTLTDFRLIEGQGTGIPGMTLDNVTGTISGNVPSADGIHNLFVEATFTRGSIVETRQAEYSVVVYNP
jgi:hypothetical protein